MPGNEFNMKKAVGAAILFVAIGGFVGYQVGQMPWVNGATSVPPPDADFAPLYTAWQLLDENFVPEKVGTTTEALSSEEKIYGAIKGLAGAYGDDYTVFLPPVENELFESEERGNFGGVGMEIDVKEGVLTVVSPLKSSPAEKAGLKAGDRILKIDGESTDGLTATNAVLKIRGPEGTDVLLYISRDGEESRDVTITRATIEPPVTETYLRSDGVYVIELYSFNALSPQKFREGVAAFFEAKTPYLIIDLRGNPGGYLEAAVDMASWFLPVGKPVVIQDFGGKQEDIIYRSKGYDVFNENLKLAIVIDGGSASASEILAGALKDYGLATLVGEKTYGKGSAQQLFNITENTSIKITVSRWLTPNRTSISKNGIEADIAVERTKEDVEAGKDPQLDRAAEFLLTGK